MWPNAKIAVMGGEQAAGVLTTVKVAGAKKAGTYDKEAADSYFEQIRTKYDGESQAYFATSRLWDDGIIEPTQTREVLTLALATTANAPVPPTNTGVFRM
jgi:3-methylcrotonyl-CoA carboxylase beta subunit